MNEKLELGCRVAVGLVTGVYEYYVKPLPSDMLAWATGKLIQFDMPTQEDIDDHIRFVAGSE